MAGTHFIVQVATAQMPASVRCAYIRVAVLEVEEGLERVAMISERARGCRRVVATWERRCVGRTERSASARAIAEAETMAADLNARAARAHHIEVMQYHLAAEEA